MAFIIKDRVKENTTSTGTGAVSLGGAAATFDTFQSYMTNGDTTYYAIVHTTSGTDEWEVGLGTWNTGNTLTRTTVLAGSNGTSAVNFSAGTKDVFMTYPASKAAVAGEDVTFADITVTGTVDGRDVAADGTKLDGIDTSADVTDATTVAAAGALMKSGGTMTGNLILNADPTTALGAATKEYVDTIASAGIHYHDPVRVEAPSALTVTYDNGSSGVGATLTNAGTQAAITIDGVALSLNDRVLIYKQTDQTQNGVYTVTTVGSGSTNWVLTRSTDTDSYGASDPDSFGKGDAFFVKEGNTGAGELYVMTTAGTITFGTTNIVFSQVAETAVYSAGTGITLTGTTFSIGQDVATSANVTFNQVTAAIIGNVTGNLTGDVTGNADTATALETARTIQLSGDVTGSATFDGSANINITAAVQDDSHAHVISNVDGLQTALDGKVPTTRTITAGNGLTGGGDLSANRTLTVGGGTGVTVNANDIAIGQDVATTASPTFAGMTTTGNVSFGDNDKAIFGAGSDLQIYHDGNHSYIVDQGTGHLKVFAEHFFVNNSDDTEQMIGATVNGAIDLFYDGAKKLATTSTGIDVTGTVTADGLTVDLGNATDVTLNGTDGGGIQFNYGGVNQVRIDSASNDGGVYHAPTGKNHTFKTDGANRLKIATGGDISFYEDTGTTAKFFWDASAESLGIGAAPSFSTLELTADKTTADNLQLTLRGSTNTNKQMILGFDTTSDKSFITSQIAGSAPKPLVINASEVGIGTSSPAAALQVVGSFSNQIKFGTNTSVYTDMSMGSGFTVFNSIGGDSGAFDFRDDGTSRMFIDSSGNVGIGTNTPSTVLHINDATDPILRLQRGGAAYSQFQSDSAGSLYISADAGNTSASSRMQFNVDGSERMRIKSDGNVQINGQLHFTDTGSLIARPTTNALSFNTNGSERMRIDSSGRVGIGTSSPSGSLSAGGLHVTDRIAVGSGTVGTPALHYDGDTDTGIFFGTGVVGVSTGGSEAMRITSTGDLLVGKTTAGLANVGHELDASGYAYHTRDSANALYISRKTNDGNLIQFYKNSTNVGSIGAKSDDLYINTGDTGIRFNDGNDQIWPVSSSGTSRDAAIDLGGSGIRFKDLYLSGTAYIAGNAAWHAGNDGSGSGLDADTLDGNHASAFLTGNQTITLSGDVSGSGTTSISVTVADDSHNHSISTITDEHRLFNNMGDNHGTTTNFNSVSQFGVRYLQGGTNGPTGTGSHQWYGFTLGLGNDYQGLNSSGDYGSQFYWNRFAQGGNNYIWIRDQENGSWGSWRKPYAGKADAWTTARTLSLSGDASGSVSWDGSGNATLTVDVGNANSVDGYSVSTTRNAASTIPVRDSNGYLQLGWINTTSGSTTGTINKIYASYDDYIRYITPATLISQLGLATTDADVQFNTVEFGDAAGPILSQERDQNLKLQGSSGTDVGITGYGSDGNWDFQLYGTGGTQGFLRSNWGAWSVYCDTGGNFTATGNVTAYSDERLKDNIEVIDKAVDKVKSIRGVTYNRNDDEDYVRQAGVIAQEVEKVLPEVVQENSDGIKTVAYGNMVGLLIEAIKEQQAQIDELKAKLEV